jgi:hypothetical protein
MKGKEPQILIDLQISHASLLKVWSKPEHNNNAYQLFQNLHRIGIGRSKTAKGARDLTTWKEVISMIMEKSGIYLIYSYRITTR